MVNEADVLTVSYEDRCTIARYVDVEDHVMGITKPVLQTVVTDVPCALSQNTSKDSLAVVEGTGMVNVTYEDLKVFIPPNIRVIKGDQITLKQSTGQTHLFIAKKPFYYPSHAEINVTGRDING